MPAAGQTMLVDFVRRGGGLVTTEWLLWHSASGFVILNPILPVNPTMDYDLMNGHVTFTQKLPDSEGGPAH
jgi:hypothetical protein